MPHAASNPALKALTDWWTDMGVEPDAATMKALAKSIQHTPEPAPNAGSRPKSPPARRGNTKKSVDDWIAEAKALAADCDTINALKSAIESFDGCPLKSGCDQTAVFDGVVGAPLMVIGEGPGAEEDRRGLPFVGRAGQLLDKMLAAINVSRAENAFITNVNYWRPPGNRNPEPDELAVCRPFVDRMIVLGAPKLIVAAGNVPTKSLLDTANGIMKTRGKEYSYTPPGGIPVPFFPIFHPAFLLRRPIEKSRAWRDLLAIEDRLTQLT